MMDVKSVLGRAFASVAVSIDLAPDEDIDPDVAEDILEPVATMFRDLPDDVRSEVADIITEMATLEDDPQRRDSMLRLPSEFGIVDDETS